MEANAQSTAKILTVGPGLGSLKELFAKIKSINGKHGPFDFALCVGDLFSSEGGEQNVQLLLENKLDVPFECYIMQGEHPLPQAVIDKFAKTGGELCSNVFLLSKSGVIRTAHGVRIACLGGVYDAKLHSLLETAPGFLSRHFAAQTIDRLQSNALSKNSAKEGKNYTSLASIQSNASSSELVDILLSNVLPPSITQFSAIPMKGSPAQDAYPVDELVRRLKPRYHFTCAGGSFWEREPYVWQDQNNRVSRFVNLGPFGGAQQPGKKERWFYAFTISSDTSAAPPANKTPNPFTERDTNGLKRSAPDGENFIFGENHQTGKRVKREGDKPPPGYKCKRCEATDHFINDCPERTKPPDGYLCKICNIEGHLVRDCPTKHAPGDTGGRKPRPGYVCRACGSEAHYLDDCPASSRPYDGHSNTRRGPPKEITSDECWFCLSNPNLAKHLIVSIGSECYATLPKGQLVPTSTSESESSSEVPGGGHVLIIPIAHYPTFPSIPAEFSGPIMQDVTRYKSALRKLYATYKSVGVFFEVGRQRARGGHAHVQAVPVPASLSDKVETTFLEEARRQGYDLVEDADETSGSGYFKVELPDGRKLVHVIPDGAPFGLQFGREVVASILGQPQRSDWKVCVLSEDEDKADALNFKNAFQSFDPSLV
ncbi:nuclear protein [Pterulicium gracile]|uniref:Nuclear protein n=1 Tax=Pterulicium gracile TaxID=1884261 RepID=A0A5C3QZ36_9AGAR|nr:nuclear protein [Pterula gracilis]